MELRQLKTFRTVATLLHFHKAARVLNYSQSAISSQIQALEDSLGTRLFDRLPRRGITLTEAGQRLLEYADRVLNLASEARVAVTGGRPTGQLHVRMPETLSVHHMPGLIRAFQTQYPECRLNFSACRLSGLEKDLGGGVYDLAFLIDESLNAKTLKVRFLNSLQMGVVVGRDHPLAGRKKITLVDLKSHPLLFSRTDCSYRHVFERLMADAGINPGNIMELNSVAAILECVAQGIGFTVVPAITAKQGEKAGRLKTLFLDDGPMDMGVLMIWHREKFVSPVMNAFMETAVDYFGNVKSQRG